MRTALIHPSPGTGEGHLGSVSVKEYQGFVFNAETFGTGDIRTFVFSVMWDIGVKIWKSGRGNSPVELWDSVSLCWVLYLTKWHFTMKCAGQPKSCLLFAGLGGPVATDHCASCDKVWVEDSVYERQMQGASTRSMSLELREWSAYRMSCRIRWDADVASQPRSTEVLGEHCDTRHHCERALQTSLRLQQGSVPHVLLRFSEEASERVLEEHWEVRFEMHFWVTAETKSIQWKNSHVLQALWMLQCEKFSVCHL